MASPIKVGVGEPGYPVAVAEGWLLPGTGVAPWSLSLSRQERGVAHGVNFGIPGPLLSALYHETLDN